MSRRPVFSPLAALPHLAFVLPDMAGGGTERLTIELMAGLAARGCRIDLVLQRREGALLGEVPAGVRVIDLAAPRLRGALRPLRRYLRAEAPDAVLTAMWPLTVVAVLAAMALRQRPRLVLADHCMLTRQYAGRWRRLALRVSVWLAYPRADAVIGVSQGVSEEIAALAGLPAARVTVIPNPVAPPRRSGADPKDAWQGCGCPRILTIGRLTPQKNQRLLIDAFAALARPDAVLAIVGAGELAQSLAAHAAALGLARRVRLPGFCPTPGDWYLGADLFVLSSDYEGMGNVLVEALHAGLPIVATDCPSGPREVLGDGRWGTLVPCGDAAALAAAMRAALSAPTDRDAQRARAARYSVARAIAAYARVLVPA